MNTKKLKECPVCGCDNLRDKWVTGRKLQQSCDGLLDDLPNSEELIAAQGDDRREEYDHSINMWVSVCNWAGEPRIPEQLKIVRRKPYGHNDYGHNYTVFDRYGHTMTMSRGYASMEAAMPEMEKVLRRGLEDENAGPYTVLWWKGGKLFNQSVEVKLPLQVEGDQ